MSKKLFGGLQRCVYCEGHGSTRFNVVRRNGQPQTTEMKQCSCSFLSNACGTPTQPFTWLQKSPMFSWKMVDLSRVILMPLKTLERFDILVLDRYVEQDC